MEELIQSDARLGEPFHSHPNFYFSLVKRDGDEYSISSLTHFLSYLEKEKEKKKDSKFYVQVFSVLSNSQE